MFISFVSDLAAPVALQLTHRAPTLQDVVQSNDCFNFLPVPLVGIYVRGQVNTQAMTDFIKGVDIISIADQKKKKIIFSNLQFKLRYTLV